MASLNVCLRRFAAISCIVIAAAGCSKGIDRHLETGNGAGAFRASLEKALPEASEKENAAFAWALSDGITVSALHGRYPNATLRDVIRGEVKRVVDEYPQVLAALEPKRAASDALLGELKKVVAEDIQFSLERDFFGLQPRISATVSNRGTLSISYLKWHAAIFVDGRNEPAAEAELYDLYNDARIGASLRASGGARQAERPSQGLLPSASANRKFTVGTLSGEPKWKTIEIQNAKQVRVELFIIPSSVKNLADQPFWEPATSADYNARKNALEKAKSFSDI